MRRALDRQESSGLRPTWNVIHRQVFKGNPPRRKDDSPVQLATGTDFDGTRGVKQ